MAKHIVEFDTQELLDLLTALNVAKWESRRMFAVYESEQLKLMTQEDLEKYEGLSDKLKEVL